MTTHVLESYQEDENFLTFAELMLQKQIYLVTQYNLFI